MQLFTINCFIEAKDKEVTQIPVAFAFMKRRRREDYVAVLKAIDDLLLVRNVKFLVTDFEAAALTQHSSELGFIQDGFITWPVQMQLLVCSHPLWSHFHIPSPAIHMIGHGVPGRIKACFF